MRIVVVGASGNIGTAVLRRLRDEPDVEVVGIARRVPSPDAEEYRGVGWRSVDVGRASVAELAELLDGADAVVHAAWALQPNHDERRLWRTNVTGTRRVLEAAAHAGVGQIVVLSSVGAYSAGPKRGRVDETWPTGGLHTSAYSRHKAAVERLMDAVEQSGSGLIVTRIRPGLVMHAAAAAEVTRLFVGPFLPARWLGRVPVPLLPLPSSTISQVVHADDLADAIWRAIERRAGGAFNIAAEPVITPETVAGLLGGRHVPVRAAVVRAAVSTAWRLRLVRSDPGWIDIATSVPVMDVGRAREVLGWTAKVDGQAALEEMISAVGNQTAIGGSPALRRDVVSDD